MAQRRRAVDVELDDDRRALARAAQRRAHVGRQLGQLFGVCGRQSDTGLPVWLKLSLISAWSAARWRYGGQLREHADDQREQPVQQDLADPGGRREGGLLVIHERAEAAR